MKPPLSFNFLCMKGKISFLLIGSMAAAMLNLGIANAAAPSSNPFTDVKSSDSDYQAILWLSQNGVIKGYSDGTYRPNSPVNRAEMLKMIFVADGNEKNATAALTTGQMFPDTPKTEWYAEYVALARTRGTVQGYPDGYFRPSNNINKAEAYKVVLKEFYNETTMSYAATHGSYPLTGSAAKDVKSTDWFAEYINFAALKNLYDAQITNGGKGVYFYPGQDLTRGELALLIYRAKAVSDNFPNNIQDDSSIYSSTTIPFTTNLYSYNFADSSGKPTGFTITDANHTNDLIGYATKYPQSLLISNGDTPNTLNFYEGSKPSALDITIEVKENPKLLSIKDFFAQNPSTDLYAHSQTNEALLVNSNNAVWFHKVQLNPQSALTGDEVVVVSLDNAIAIITDHGSLHEADGVFNYMVRNFWFKNFAV